MTLYNYTGNKGWPIVGATELFTKLGNGKIRDESFFHEIKAKYGPISRFKAPGNPNIDANFKY